MTEAVSVVVCAVIVAELIEVYVRPLDRHRRHHHGDVLCKSRSLVAWWRQHQRRAPADHRRMSVDDLRTADTAAGHSKNNRFVGITLIH